jgi:hypothetical protein
MQQDENAVIRYLMKEMDPSEELLMERAMMEDDDLLIEVESMRKMLHRVDDLPAKQPPADLTKSLVQQAADYKKQQSRWPSVPSGFYKYAAVLIIGAGLSSGLWMFFDSSPEAPVIDNPAAIISTLQPEAAENVAADAEPWVDRDDVIYFQDMFNEGSTGYNAILEASMEKLTPVNNQPFRTNPNARGVQLTGSSN